MKHNLKDYICLVTGATRGIGRGIALGLGECGATVYITGRTEKAQADSSVGGSLEDTAREITERGGIAIPVVVDHSDDDQIHALFNRICSEQNGRLDLLVNSAYSAVNYLCQNIDKPFYSLAEKPGQTWDIVNRVGLRNNYICSTLACQMMIKCRSQGGNDQPGVLINISSLGAKIHMFNTAYGVGKAAVDRMTKDMDQEIRANKENICVISLHPGAVKTEHLLKYAEENKSIERLTSIGESPELSGRVVAALAAEPRDQLMARSGQVLTVAELAISKGIKDVDGKSPMNLRSVKLMLAMNRYRIAPWIPAWILLPNWLFDSIVARL